MPTRRANWKPPRRELPPRYTQKELELVAIWRFLNGMERARDNSSADAVLDDVREFVGEERGIRYDGVDFKEIRSEVDRLLTRFGVR